MSDQEMEAAPAADPSVGLLTAMIVLTTVMLLLATVATMKLTGERYHEGMFASK